MHNVEERADFVGCGVMGWRMKIGWMENRMVSLDGCDSFAMGSDPMEAPYTCVEYEIRWCMVCTMLKRRMHDWQ